MASPGHAVTHSPHGTALAGSRCVGLRGLAALRRCRSPMPGRGGTAAGPPIRAARRTATRRRRDYNQ